MTFTNPIYSILYIDEVEQNLISFKSTFSQDYHIYTATSGGAGLETMEQKTIQLVITDQRMPDMSGIEFLEKILILYPDCMRMIMTGISDKDAIIQAINKGNIYRYVTKPWSREDLKLNIDSAMEVYNLKIQNRNLINYLEDAKLNLEQKVMERTREIEQQRLNITDSIHYASRIQKALMLKSEVLDKLMPSHFVLNKPKDIVSGDYYWVSNKSDRLIIAVADCTGHGVPGAFMSILGINFLNEIVSNSDTLRANDILNELREKTINALGQTGQRDEAKEGMEMALCVVDFKLRMIQFSGAFRPIYLISEGELSVIIGDRMPIGIYEEEEVSFSNKEVPFKENDIIYLFTDGYVDQIGGLQRKTFKSVRFKKLLKEIYHKPLEEQKSILREEHEIWRAGQEQIDDILILGVELST
ncbi:MAG: response regulator [Bacteroidetes bacterium]|nr:response regulator [Bacteroidota bacterium]